MNRLSAISLALLLCACKPPEDSHSKAIIGAVLIDGNGGPPVTDSVVVVQGNRIRAAGSRVNVPVPAAADKIDGRGKFLVPGLIDLHVHLGTSGGPGFLATDYTRERIEKNLKAYLHFGVTTVRSAGTEREAGFAVRNAQREGASLGARLFTAGRGFTAKGGHPAQEIGEIARQPGDPEDARKQAGELAQQHVDLIKIWVDDLHGRKPKVKREVIEAILDEARIHKIPVVAHISTLADTEHLVNAGAAGFLHMIRDTEDLDSAFLTRLRDLKLVFTPTLVRQELAWLYQEQPQRLDDPEATRAADADAIAAIRSWSKQRPAPADLARREFDIAKRNSRKVASSGVLIGVGSDGGSSVDLPGLMTHREIELLVESGFTPVEAISAATRTGAIALGKAEELGTLAPGRRADLLLLTANPLEDVRNLRKIERVMQDGEWVERK